MSNIKKTCFFYIIDGRFKKNLLRIFI